MTKKIYLTLIGSLIICIGLCQQTKAKKYPSLFWEITGNGLKKPSYLFGTMHVSSKLAFHLSDSFYYALKSVDAVALELNPEIWQPQMIRLDEIKQTYANYKQHKREDYLKEKSFAIDDYYDDLKTALSSEPIIVNSLLYRNYAAKEDFEEDTFLDLYIYQTGKKLGKRGTGVEDFYESEKLIIQAYSDMANEKKKKTYDADGEGMMNIREKIEAAYKSGDLDLMDSLDLKIDQSPAFREKFIYTRNEIQAKSMDTIMQKSALFVGVGAAHLPGKKGVIELLREMGYKLRPIKMTNRDAIQKEKIDQMSVPVLLKYTQTIDDLYTVSLPGNLYKMSDDYQRIDRRQYADMNNGSYYMVSRVKTHALFAGQTPNDVLKKIDSLLYEHIPGKIITKKDIEKNGYQGYDIVNKTRKGDIQRYNIYVTPFDILIFKISVKENYVKGAVASLFFNSIQLKNVDKKTTTYSPKHGGFSISLPHHPQTYLNNFTTDGIKTWEYEAFDSTTGNAYLLLKKTLYNDFIEEDSFDVQLMEESFKKSTFISHTLSSKISTQNGYPCMLATEKMKDSSLVFVKHIIQGPHYYTLAVKCNKQNKEVDNYLNSFAITPFKYSATNSFTDTFLHFSVTTNNLPVMDESYRAAIEKLAVDMAKSSTYNRYGNEDINKSISLQNDTTGECIHVSFKKFDDYYFVRDSIKFWESEVEEMYDTEDVVVFNKKLSQQSNGSASYYFSVKDTGSSRCILNALYLKNNYLFTATTTVDTLSAKSQFVESFFNSFSPQDSLPGPSIFVQNLPAFFNDLLSKDSATHTKAQNAIGKMYYGEKGIPFIKNTLNTINPNFKNYYDTKSKLIVELGYIADTTQPVIVDYLKQLYEQTADTSIFQNQVFKALAQHKTKKAIDLFKEMVLIDPPVFDDNYGYDDIFNSLEDSLQLAATLYPDILQLTTLEDYKQPIISLLTTLVDSGFIQPKQYESYFSKIFFDAKIALKKQLAEDEKILEEENTLTKDENEEPAKANDYSDYSYNFEQYGVLMMPFYEKNANIVKYFDKLLRSKNNQVKLDAVETLLKNKKPVPDSILLNFATSDIYRSRLYRLLQRIGQLDKFPAKYNNQLQLATSLLLNDKSYATIDSIEFLYHLPVTFKKQIGKVYVFKYRVKKEDDFKFGISGLQPADSNDISLLNELTSMTDNKLKPEKNEKEQVEEIIKKMVFGFHKSADKFYNNFDNQNYLRNFKF